MFFVIVLFLCAAPAFAQQPTRPDTTVMTPEQRAMARLRALNRIGTPDTLRVDTALAQQAQRAVQQRAAPSPIERDSIMAALLGLSGYMGTEFSGGRARFQADSSRLVMRDMAQVSREGNILAADSSITYDEKRALACGFGKPVLTAADMSNPVVSDTVCFDIEKRIGYAIGATTTMTEGAAWVIRCNATFGADNLFCHNAFFTDCNEPWPHQHYYFAAEMLKVDPGNTLVARNVTLRFRDVPVFWLPFMVQSLSRGRRSGILMPRFGINDIARNSARYNRRIEDVGFYWAVNDYMGAELAMDWAANNFTALRGSFDYNLPKKFLQGGLTHRQYWADEGNREFTIASRNSWVPNERTNVQLSANYATSSAFVRGRTIDPRELNKTIDSQASLNRRFDWGSLSMGVQRRQHLSDNTVAMQLPHVGLTISQQTLFGALPGEERWFSNASWGGNMDFGISPTTIAADNASVTAQSRRETRGTASSSFKLGNFGFSQGVNFNERRLDARAVPTDSTPIQLAQSNERRGSWNTNLSYQIGLIGTTTFVPNATVRGEFMRSDKTADRTITAPVSMDFGAGLRTDVFAIIERPVGPFAAIRHKLSPGIDYSYSPEAPADSLQKALFGGGGVLERNQISFSLAQSFEAKYRDRGEDDPERRPGTRDGGRIANPTDSVMALDSLAEFTDTTTGPRPRDQVSTVQLLSITTNALVYDFVKAREDNEGLTTAEISNSITSSLLQGLSLTLSHSLFTPAVKSAAGGGTPRQFDVHLSNVSASFSLSASSWLFRILRLGAAPDSASMATQPLQRGDITQAGPAVDRTVSDYSMVGSTRRNAPGMARGRVGAWNANFRYSLVRPRAEVLGERGNQTVTSMFTFQPTENWSVNWDTQYSITDAQFSDHRMTLSRSLHDWDANFTFLKAQNGNFAFTFAVHLRANPDIKVDYSQTDVRGIAPRRF